MDKAHVFREAGHVRRMHTTPLLQHYDVAQHSWNMAALLFHLHPNPSQALTWAVLFHDVAERYTGDMPYPAKHLFDKQLELNWADLEQRMAEKLGIDFNLTDDEKAWLSALDTLELWCFCMDEHAMGNSCVMNVRQTCRQLLEADNVPAPIKEWVEARSFNRSEEVI